jgi:hypothetical protein
MSSDNRFGLLRKILRTIGLSQQASDDAVNFIGDLLLGEGKGTIEKAPNPEFPYHLRDNFLSPAELSFYNVLRTVIGSRAVLLSKVALGDVFWVKQNDPSRFRIYTNKIDRKHVDFLICHAVTMQPLVGVELDDKSHQRQDHQERDAFVNEVFQAAGLPLLHIPARRSYRPEELTALLTPYLEEKALLTPLPQPVENPPVEANRLCPKCGSVMVMRTAKKGENAGNQFWGCSNYPSCRSMLPYQGQP